jgi:excisionase family DNA binding protein
MTRSNLLAPEAPSPPARGYCSAAAAAVYVGLSPRTIASCIKDGRLPAHRVGRRVLIKFSDVDRMITGRDEEA